MNDLKYQSAVKTIEAMKRTHCVLRLDPTSKGDDYLYNLLKSYGLTWDGETWQPFAGNPCKVYA